MKPLRDWSAPRVAAFGIGWLLGLPILVAPAVFGAVGWLARAERERTVTAAQDSIVPGLRVAYLPSESGDFLTSFGGPGLVLILGLLLLPPLALGLTWIVARRRPADQPT